MGESRRNFLKKMGAGSALAAAPAVLAAAGPGEEEERTDGGAEEAETMLPKGLTLCTLKRGGEWGLGVRTARGILDVEAAADHFDIDGEPESADELLQEGGGEALQEVIAAALAAKHPRPFFLAEEDVIFGPAVTNPEKIVMVGLNYRRHAAEIGMALPSSPVLFNKFNNALLGHGRTLRLPTKVARQFDYEVELVIVMGRTARDVGEADALSYVAGYCTGNDFSARDLQRRTSQIMLGKIGDGFAPLGPWLVSADQVPDPNALDLWCDVNGERRQSSNTRDMVFNCAQLVSYCSGLMTLKPGDLIYTGTPEGVVLGKPEDKQVWLKAGDRVSCGIEKLGELRFDLA
ncbi:MAG TPA: fumarylacetoacetate hydrolase family protein, partial [Burkholderiales bacterium]|nr:fumarylacetoacetate hydrolase family protein [Burkholderiales bacterium]